MEQDRLRGLSIIESGAKLDKLPADEQAALISENAVSTEKARLKALLNNKVIDPIALSSNVDEAMKNITKASSNFTLEYNNADKIAEKIARDNPSIDYVLLRDDLRNDVKNRRIKENKFVDPNNVEASTLITDINNPENLSKYVKNYNTLNKVIASKQSSEPVRVMVGSPREYSTYAGRTGFWSKPTFESNALGFVSGGKAPSQENKGVEILNEPLPVGALKGVNKQFDMVPDNVYKRFLDEGGREANTEISALAQNAVMKDSKGNPILDENGKPKKLFSEYKNFSPQEKEFANRKVLYDYLSEKDADGFANVGYTSPPRSLFGEQKQTESEKRAQIVGNYLNSFTNAISSGNESEIKDLANKFYGLKGGKANYSGVKVFKRPDGSVTGFQISYKDDKGQQMISDVIKTTDPNLRDKVQGVYQKISGSETSAEIANLKDLNIENSKNTFKFGGKSYTRQQLEKGAKYYGISLDEYINRLKNQ